MNSRERVRCVLNRQQPDSVPRGIYDVMIDCYNDTTIEFFKKMTGKHPRDCFRHDIRGVNPVLRKPAPEEIPWYKKISRITTVDELRRTGFYEDTVKCRYTKMEIQEALAPVHAAGYASFWTLGPSLAMNIWRLRGGMEHCLMDMMDHEPWLDVLLDWLTEGEILNARVAAEAGPDIFCMGDDVATQKGMLFSPALWHELFYPRYKRIVTAVKETNPHVAVFFHCCGNVTDIIPDLIDAGIDILNPIQPEAMDPAEVKRRYGKNLILWGGLGVQSTMSQGTPEDVERAVKNLMETVGAGGGYILSPAHMINPDISWENIVAFFEAADRYGNYK